MKPILRQAWIALSQAAFLLAAGCEGPTPPWQIELQQRVDALTAENEQIKRDLDDKREVIAGLEKQVGNLRAKPDAPLVFSVDRIELANLTGGTDLDGKPGDDGVVVYVRPLDAAGDVLKAAGEIHVQVLDITGAEPKLLGDCNVNDPEELRKSWYGKFMTNHYTIKCPWASAPPGQPEVMIRVTFTDFATGKVFVAHQAVRVNLPSS